GDRAGADHGTGCQRGELCRATTRVGFRDAVVEAVHSKPPARPSNATAVRLCTVVGRPGPRNRRAPESDLSSATASLTPPTTHNSSPPGGAERVLDMSAP